jgi:plasmid stabilization system protein ParE
VKLIISRAALADFARLHDFLAARNPDAARRAIDALIRAVQSLDTSPERGRPAGTPRIRELIVPFGRYGYVLRYSYSASADEVVVLRLWHGREARE